MTSPEASPEAATLAAVLADLDRLVTVVATDVGEPPEAVRPSVEHAARLLGGGAGREQAAAEMLQAGMAAARAGLPRRQLLDRYLTTAWAVWDAAAATTGADRRALASLGTRLLHGADITAGFKRAAEIYQGKFQRHTETLLYAVLPAAIIALLDSPSLDAQ